MNKFVVALLAITFATTLSASAFAAEDNSQKSDCDAAKEYCASRGGTFQVTWCSELGWHWSCTGASNPIAGICDPRPGTYTPYTD